MVYLIYYRMKLFFFVAIINSVYYNGITFTAMVLYQKASSEKHHLMRNMLIRYKQETEVVNKNKILSLVSKTTTK